MTSTGYSADGQSIGEVVRTLRAAGEELERAGRQFTTGRARQAGADHTLPEEQTRAAYTEMYTALERGLHAIVRSLNDTGDKITAVTENYGGTDTGMGRRIGRATD